jgi:hypothetical protein
VLQPHCSYGITHRALLAIDRTAAGVTHAQVAARPAAEPARYITCMATMNSKAGVGYAVISTPLPRLTRHLSSMIKYTALTVPPTHYQTICSTRRGAAEDGLAHTPVQQSRTRTSKPHGSVSNMRWPRAHPNHHTSGLQVSIPTHGCCSHRSFGARSAHTLSVSPTTCSACQTIRHAARQRAALQALSSQLPASCDSQVDPLRNCDAPLRARSGSLASATAPSGVHAARSHHSGLRQWYTHE